MVSATSATTRFRERLHCDQHPEEWSRSNGTNLNLRGTPGTSMDDGFIRRCRGKRLPRIVTFSTLRTVLAVANNDLGCGICSGCSIGSGHFGRKSRRRFQTCCVATSYLWQYEHAPVSSTEASCFGVSDVCPCQIERHESFVRPSKGSSPTTASASIRLFQSSRHFRWTSGSNAKVDFIFQNGLRQHPPHMIQRRDAGMIPAVHIRYVINQYPHHVQLPALR